MSKKLFSVYDSKTEAYLPPLAYKTKAEALREFEQAAQSPQSNIGKYPTDYSLFELADFNEDTAEIIPHKIPLLLSNASEFISKSL